MMNKCFKVLSNDIQFDMSVSADERGLGFPNLLGCFNMCRIKVCPV